MHDAWLGSDHSGRNTQSAMTDAPAPQQPQLGALLKRLHAATDSISARHAAAAICAAARAGNVRADDRRAALATCLASPLQVGHKSQTHCKTAACLFRSPGHAHNTHARTYACRLSCTRLQTALLRCQMQASCANAIGDWARALLPNPPHSGPTYAVSQGC